MDFNTFLSKTSKESMGDVNVSHEVIEYQGNDPIVKKIIAHIDNIREIYTDNPGLSPDDLWKILEPAYIKFEADLKDRFGINIKLLDLNDRELGISGSPATIPVMVPAKSKSASYKECYLYKDKERYRKELDNLKTMNPITKFIKRRIMQNYNLYLEKAFECMQTSGFEDVLNVIEKEGIVVDLKNAKIINFPDTMVAPIILPIGQMVAGVKGLFGIHISYFEDDTSIPREITSKAIAGILMHEIGHSFTSIELAAQSYSNNIVFEDVLQDQLRKNSKDISNAFIMAYEKAYNDKTIRKDLIGKSDSEVIITCCSRAMDRYNYAGYETRNMGEAAADQFANRFGLGVASMASLSSIFIMISYRRRLRRIFTVDIPLFLLIFISINFWFNMIIGAAASGGASILLTIGFLFYSFYKVVKSKIIGILFFILVSEIKKTGDYPYDDDYTRVERIRNDLVRILRTHNLSTREQRDILEQYDKVESLLKRLREDGVKDHQFFNSNPILNLFSKASRDLCTYGRFDRDLEDMMENPLYVDQIKIIIGDE